MRLVRVLKKVRWGQLWVLIVLCITNILFVFPTVKATQRTMMLSYKHFQRKHHENGPANAFRHALWNYLIAKKCTKWSKNDNGVLTWTKKITDWHEQAFPNRALAQKMDLHNNAVGRALFKKHRTAPEETIISLLLQMVNESLKITADTVLERHSGTFVHLID